jgi:hypothetical protein
MCGILQNKMQRLLRKCIYSGFHGFGCDVPRFKQYFYGILRESVYFAPSAFEGGFISIAHGEKEIEET